MKGDKGGLERPSLCEVTGAMFVPHLHSPITYFKANVFNIHSTNIQ